MTKNMKCPICKKQTKQKFYASVSDFESYECRYCFHIYVSDSKLRNFDFSGIYGHDFYENYCNGLGYHNAYEAFMKDEFLKKIKLISSYLQDGGTVLEVGSGPGFFAKLLSDRGYKVTAVELNPAAKEYAKNTSKFLNIIDEDLLDRNCSIYGHEFDCVVSWAVIEHVHDVEDYVQLLKQYTKKGGYICVDTGIRTRFLSLVDRGFSSWLVPPYHLHVFSDKSIVNLFRNCGLSISYFKPHFNYSTSTVKILIRYCKELIKASLDFTNTIKKKKPGKIAIIGLLIARNE